MASYYNWCTCHFADIAATLYARTKKGGSFTWTAKCAKAFTALKYHLVNAPFLAFPHFDHNPSEFRVQMDVSAVGVSAVLGQGDHAVAYTS